MRKMTNKRQKNLENAVYVSWEESERGWGTRPDGCSLHLNREDYQKFVENYWKGMPKEVPEEYSRPAGRPCDVKVSRRVFNEIKKIKYGTRYYDDKLEIDGEIVFGKIRDGWVPYGDY